MKDFRHWWTGNVCPLLRQSAFCKIAASMLAIGKVDVTDDIDDTAVCLFRKVLILASITCFHVEDRYVQTLCSDNWQAWVCIAKNKYSIGLYLRHEFIGSTYDISHCWTEVIANGIHIHFWFFQLQVFEKDAVQVIVIVLACMSKDCVEIDAALTDNGCKADNFRSCSYNYQKFQLAVFRKFYIWIVSF